METRIITVLPTTVEALRVLIEDAQERLAIIMDGAEAEAAVISGSAPTVLGPVGSSPPAGPEPVATSASSTLTPPDEPPATAAAPSLGAFTQVLRDYQESVLDEAAAFVDRALALPDSAPDAARRILFASPTGSGKGTVELALLSLLRGRGHNAWVYTPSLEVLRGFLERCGVDPAELADATADKLAALGESIYCTTPMRHRNRILAGDAEVPGVIIYDEVHHATENNEVSGTLFALAPLAAWVGFTATPYRGSPKGTLELNKAWPDIVEVLTIPEAVREGWWALPRFEVVGLCDDDKVRMTGGEFQSKAAGNLVAARIDDLAKLVADRFKPMCYQSCVCGLPQTGPCVRLPTVVVVPSVDCAAQMVEALDRVGVTASMVVGTTKPQNRAAAYARCRSCEDVLVTVEVLAEGVDMPWLRRMFDCSPTMSPVRWLQRIGRLTRPGGARPEVIVCCRNLERHAYLLGGLIPRAVVAAAQAEFEAPTKRGGYRSIGFESLNRFKPIEMPLVGGVKGTMFALYSNDDSGAVTEWAFLLDPTSERSVVAKRVSHKSPTETHEVTLPNGMRVEAPEITWGKWVAAEAPVDLQGYATSKHKGSLSTKQQEWWTRSARRLGLDPGADITRRQFAALPILTQLGCGMHPLTAQEGE